MRSQGSVARAAVMCSALMLAVPLWAGSQPLLAQVAQSPSPPSTSGQSARDAMSGMPHQGHTMKTDDMTGKDPAMVMPGDAGAVRFTEKEWSEFNHRGAGWFLLFWGLAALAAGLEWPRRTWRRFAPAIVLLGLVEFLFIRNDPESWPTGSIGLWASLSDRGVFQHRVFVLLLLAMVVVELLRAGDRLSPFFATFSLPGLALFGGIYLFFHEHGGGDMQQMARHMSNPLMAASPAMKATITSMDTVKHEHLWFSVLGFGLVGARLLADGGWLRGRFGATLWTMFAIILGIYMMGYVE
jgi:hypothetical protein